MRLRLRDITNHSPIVRFELRPNRQRLYWLRPTTIAAALLVFHFLESFYLWGYYFITMGENPTRRHDILPNIRGNGSQLITLIVLFGFSVVSLITALRGYRWTLRLLLITLFASLAAFAYDVKHQRWQLHTFIATQDYWDAGGREHDYFTWWWYNDRWLH